MTYLLGYSLVIDLMMKFHEWLLIAFSNGILMHIALGL
jgi:hypothetical protein